MLETQSEAVAAITFGISSLRYEPERGVAIAPNYSVLKESIDRIPKDYALVFLPPNHFADASGSLAGRKNVLLLDGGNAAWRTKAELMLQNVNAVVVQPPATLVLTRGDTIKPKPVRWLWDGWLALGKLHILAGAAGTGKTTIALALASILTTGDRWPDNTTSKRGGVLIWSSEDDPDDTLVPRMTAMGANMSFVHFISGVDDPEGRRAFDPAHDTAILLQAIRNIKPALLIIDPIVSAVAGDSHKNTETRRALQPLVDLAAELGIALLGITHFSKGSTGRDPLERVTGSLAFGAIARVVMAAGKLPEEKGGGRILCRAKSNIGNDTGGFRYDLEQAPVTAGLWASRIKWGEAIDETARELLAETEGGEGGSDLEAAKEFLLAELANGSVGAKSIKISSEHAGHAWRTIRRAKDALGVIAEKVGLKEGWRWSLPPKMSKLPEDAQQNEVDTFGTVGHLRRDNDDCEVEL